MATTPYQKKLLDPRWQKKRLKILERDEWKCQSCYNTKKTLEIHHIKYKKNPWDSPDIDLTTYCSECHNLIEIYKKTNPNVHRIRKVDNLDGSETLYCIAVTENIFYCSIYGRKTKSDQYSFKISLHEESFIRIHNIIQSFKNG